MEFVRHRVFSFAQESTRYCNYSKNKFGNEITFIIPCWLDYEEQQFTDKDDSSIRTDLSEHEYFIDLLLEAENTYNYLVQYCKWKPQEARAVLPNACKTELIMTGFVSDWWGNYLVFDKETGELCKEFPGQYYKDMESIDKNEFRIVEKGFFPLRCSQGAHPSARELAVPLREEFIKRGYK